MSELKWHEGMEMQKYYRYFMGVYEYISVGYVGSVSVFNSTEGMFVRTTVGNYIYVEEFEKGKVRPIPEK